MALPSLRWAVRRRLDLGPDSAHERFSDPKNLNLLQALALIMVVETVLIVALIVALGGRL